MGDVTIPRIPCLFLWYTGIYFSWFLQALSGVIHTLALSFQAGDAQSICNMQEQYLAVTFAIFSPLSP